MTGPHHSPVVTVALGEATVARLAAICAEGESLDSVIERLATQQATVETVRANPVPFVQAATHLQPGRYTVRVLGVEVQGASLGKVFANVVELVASLDAAAVSRLAEMKAQTRRYVARERRDVHGGRTDLRTLKTRSGWYVSANIGRADLRRGLRALCNANDLDHEVDVVLLD